MRVGLVAHFADIGLVRGMHMHVLLTVAAVGKASVTAFKFTFERFLTCKRQKPKGGKIRSAPEFPRGKQQETELPAVFPERERRLGAAVENLFSLERNEERRLSPLGLGVVVGAGVGQGRPRT